MIALERSKFVRFVTALTALKTGHHSGHFDGRRYGVTIERPVKARITKLFAQELGGSDIVSFNLFIVGGGQAVLKPCEMASDKVIDFVLGFEPGQHSVATVTGEVVPFKRMHVQR